MKIGIPPRIDRSYWGERFSGSNGTQLMTALRFLGLIDSEGIPMTQLVQLVSAEGSQRSDILKQIGYSAYSFLMDKSLDTQVATYAQLEKAFYNAYDVSGDVARKCIKFFIELESDAGVPLSPLMMKKSRTMLASSARKRTGTKEASRTKRNNAKLSVVQTIPDQNIWYEKVLAKFPTFDTAWSDDVKLKWFEAFDILLKRGLFTDTEKR